MTLEFLIFPNEIACRIVMTLLHDSVMTIFWARETLLLKHGYESLLMNLISQKNFVPQNQEDVNLCKISKEPFKNDVTWGDCGGGYPELMTKTENGGMGVTAESDTIIQKIS